MEPLRPETAADAGGLVAEAVGRGSAVVIEGAGTRSAWQPDYVVGDVLLSTRGLQGIADVRTENMSARFSAGMTLHSAQNHLAEYGLWLPIQHLDASEATLGGCVAAGFNDPLRLGYGPPRDWILGLEVVVPDGHVLNFGGDVIKNVAGYDMVKVHIGAWGRLGLVSALTVRLLPRPDALGAIFTEILTDPGQIEVATRSVLLGRVLPGALEVEGDASGWRLIALLLGGSRWLNSQMHKLVEDLGEAGIRAQAATMADGEAAWADYAGRCNEWAVKYAWQMKVALPVPGLRAVVMGLRRSLPADQWALTGHAGSGVYTVRWNDEAGPHRVLEAISCVVAGRGHVVAERSAARRVCGTRGWVSFPPRRSRAQDRLERRIVSTLAGPSSFNRHLFYATDDGRGV